MSAPHDCLIIGGGPAGAMAAIYLARFLRRVVVVDSGHSRALWIPTSHNYPGVPEGMHGRDIIAGLRAQVALYNAEWRQDTVSALVKTADGFSATLESGDVIAARSVIMATGIVDVKPALPRMPDFIYSGAVRFCPICDGFEATDQSIAVIGPLINVIKKALFLRTFSPHLTLLPLDTDVTLSADDAEALRRAGIAAPTAPVRDLFEDDGRICAELASGEVVRFDILYPAMGAHIRSELAQALGADHTPDGCICTDTHHQSSIKSLYAIGDISTELHQISVAYGHAAIAATHLHNSLPPSYRD